MDYACGPTREEATVSGQAAPVLGALGIAAGSVVWEIGTDDDADGELREALAAAEGVGVVEDDVVRLIYLGLCLQK